ncbi:hypothetical protein SteCoe_17031 [Stentor coeruleus]|uniref:Uncharacterized protein n=1 Tax=Stentor coeruleus TaxID=5963 RepID=A0A1R2BZZ5_9CILI|nr:hypothetical protein SteCoe_17031 [Stentor coeruleus]
MVLGLLLYAILTSAQDFPQENKDEKFNACYSLTKLKYSRDQEKLDATFNQFKNPKDLNNYYTAEMLLKCYKTISLDTAETILKQGEDLVLVTDFEELIEVDISTYNESTLKPNAEHDALYKEMKDINEAAEQRAKKEAEERRKTPPLFNAGPFYVLAVVLGFGLFIFFLAHRVLVKPVKTKGKNKKRN